MAAPAWYLLGTPELEWLEKRLLAGIRVQVPKVSGRNGKLVKSQQTSDGYVMLFSAKSPFLPLPSSASYLFFGRRVRGWLKKTCGHIFFLFLFLLLRLLRSRSPF